MKIKLENSIKDMKQILTKFEDREKSFIEYTNHFAKGNQLSSFF